MFATAPTYERISKRARPYPSYLLPKEGSALALFAAGFHGWNDVIHLARAGMSVECVDTDSDKLWAMAQIYPTRWAFHVDDGWEFAERAAAVGKVWDVVTIDPFFENMAQRAWESLDLWLSLARNLVTLTVHVDTELNVPDGWTQSYFPRGDDVAWLVMQRSGDEDGVAACLN